MARPAAVVELIGHLGRANFALEQYIAKATSP